MKLKWTNAKNQTNNSFTEIELIEDCGTTDNFQ